MYQLESRKILDLQMFYDVPLKDIIKKICENDGITDKISQKLINVANNIIYVIQI